MMLGFVGEMVWLWVDVFQQNNNEDLASSSDATAATGQYPSYVALAFITLGFATGGFLAGWATHMSYLNRFALQQGLEYVGSATLGRASNATSNILANVKNGAVGTITGCASYLASCCKGARSGENVHNIQERLLDTNAAKL